MDSNQLTETHNLGGSSFLAVKASETDSPDWLAEAPVCGQLKQKNITHVGVMNAVHPFRVVRLRQSGTFMFACLSGQGQVMVDGRWVSVSAGEACLLPPFVANAIQAIEGAPDWKFCWVRYLDSPDRLPVVFSKSPVKGEFDTGPLAHAVEGLHAESLRAAPAPASCHLWIELIQGYVTEFSEPAHGDPRLWRLWQAVGSDLARPWAIREMAAIAAVSNEHLRRLCLHEMGRSPGKQVIFLRIQQACHLLATTDDKIETIAHAVGYESAFTFSTTFKKWTGLRPSEFRNS